MASYSQTSSGRLCSSPVLERAPRPRGPTLCDCQSSHMLLSFDKVRSNPPAVRACPLVADCSPYIAPTPSTNSEPGAPLSQPQAERTSVSLQRLHIAPCPPSQTHTHTAVLDHPTCTRWGPGCPELALRSTASRAICACVHPSG